MEHTKLALSAVMIVAVGLVGTNFVTGLEMTPESEMNAFVQSSPVFGHVTVIHSDPSGNIMSYSQGDNIVTREGKDCIIERLFDTTDTLITCNASSPNDLFNVIGLTNSSGNGFAEAPTLATNATLTNGLVARDLCCDGLGPASVTGPDPDLTFVAASGSTGAQIGIKNTFTATTDNNPVDGAILYNAGIDAVFAAQKFAAVTLNDQDTLAVTWTITLGTTP